MTSDVVGTLFLGAIGAAALVMGLGYGFLEEGGQVGPGFLPVTTGAFILVASLAEIVRLYLAPPKTGQHLPSEARDVDISHLDRASAGGEGDVEERDTFGRVESERNTAILRIFGLMLVTLLVVPVVGLLLALAIMVFAIVLWVEGKSVLPAVLASAGATAVAYVLFVQLLGVPAPQGMLGLL